MEPRRTERENELAATKRRHEEESMRGAGTLPPPDEGTPPVPAQVPEPYPPDELDLPSPDPHEDDDPSETEHSSRSA
jgi:hypothetical protein